MWATSAWKRIVASHSWMIQTSHRVPCAVSAEVVVCHVTARAIALLGMCAITITVCARHYVPAPASAPMDMYVLTMFARRAHPSQQKRLVQQISVKNSELGGMHLHAVYVYVRVCVCVCTC